jgi:hypothetical protein
MKIHPFPGGGDGDGPRRCARAGLNHPGAAWFAHGSEHFMEKAPRVT